MIAHDKQQLLLLLRTTVLLYHSNDWKIKDLESLLMGGAIIDVIIAGGSTAMSPWGCCPRSKSLREKKGHHTAAKP